MKKSSKLGLKRTTIHNLSAPHLRGVVGGRPNDPSYYCTGTDFCTSTCGSCDCWTWNCPSRYPNC